MKLKESELKEIIKQTIRESLERDYSNGLYNYVEKAKIFLTYTKSVIESINKIGEEISTCMNGMMGKQIGKEVSVRIDTEYGVKFITNIGILPLISYVQNSDELSQMAMDELGTEDFDDVINEIKRNNSFITDYPLCDEIRHFLGSKLYDVVRPDIEDQKLVFILDDDFNDRVEDIEEICELMLEKDIR